MNERRFVRRGFAAMLVASACFIACGWDPSRPFEREAPEVRRAIEHLDAGDAGAATEALVTYLATGNCKEGSIGTPPRVHERSNGAFDLGLALFDLAERYGQRFGAEEADAGEGDATLKAQRAEQVDCALKVVRALATDTAQPVELRARARYLEGNLLFMTSAYEEAVRAYDAALELAPGMHDSGPISLVDAAGKYSPDLVGRDAAWNRAIALRRIEDKKDAGKDAESDASNDGSSGDSGDQNKPDDDKKNDDKDAGQKNEDAGKDSGGGDSGAKDAGAKDSGADDQEKPKPNEKDAGAPPPPSRQSQDERVLDQLENAPSVQHEDARRQAQRRRVRGMSDK